MAQMVRELAAVIEKQPKGDTGRAARKPGRPVTPKGEARAEVAKVAGTTPEAVRRAETRAAAKAEPPKPAGWFLKDFGVGVDWHLDAEAARVAGHLSTAATQLARAQAAFTAATEALEQLYGADGQAHYTFAKPMLADASRLREQTHALAAAARGKVPVSLCAYGKGGCTATCNACRGLKWSTADHSAAIPAELLREGAEAMVSNGKGGTVPFAKVPGPDRPPVEGNRSVAKKGAAGRTGSPRTVAAGQSTPTATPPPPTSHTEGMGPADVAPIRPKKGPPRMQVELADGRVVDPTNPPEDMRYSGDDAPAEDLPELEVDRDEAIEWADDDGEAA
jgi:hypothetical protein